VALLLPVAAWAAFASINTDDGAIDPAWAGIAVFRASPDDPGVSNDRDIKQAKVTREADNSFWYFQVILYGQLPLDNLTSVEARISCNGDDDFTDSEDKIVLYYHADPPDNDNSIECAGNDYPSCSTDGETQGSDFGEEVAVGDGTYAYEWKADISDAGGIDWSTCNGQERIQFTVADETGATYDTTEIRGFDAPTAVDVQRLTARSGAPDIIAVGALALCGLLGLAATSAVLRRERRISGR